MKTSNFKRLRARDNARVKSGARATSFWKRKRRASHEDDAWVEDASDLRGNGENGVLAIVSRLLGGGLSLSRALDWDSAKSLKSTRGCRSIAGGRRQMRKRPTSRVISTIYERRARHFASIPRESVGALSPHSRQL